MNERNDRHRISRGAHFKYRSSGAYLHGQAVSSALLDERSLHFNNLVSARILCSRAFESFSDLFRLSIRVAQS